MTSFFNEKFKDFLNIPRLDEQMREAITKHNIMLENLTIDQTMEALKQALASGDFCKHITLSNTGDPSHQTVSYTPFRLEQILQKKIARLRGKLKSIEDILKEEE